MAKHPFFCPETSGKIALLQIKALQESSQSILFEAAKESIRVSSALAWTEVLGLEWLGWCKLVGHEHDREPLLPLTVSAGNGSYWCIKSQPADPDLIILGHLKISSGRPLVATLGRCLLCTQLRSPSTRLGRLCSLVEWLVIFIFLPRLRKYISDFLLVEIPNQGGRWRLYDFSLQAAKCEKP